MRPASDDDADAAATLVVVGPDGTEHVLGRIDGARPTLATIDLLARAHLAARRAGGVLRVDGSPPPLSALIQLCGLTGVLAVGAERHRQPEHAERVRPDEVVQPGDPPA
jgi:hypothetical protein